MARHRSHSVEFKRQVAQEYLAGDTLHGLAKRHDVSRNLIRIWVDKYEAGAFDDDARAADLIQAYEARITALERLVGKQALELEFLRGLSGSDHGREARPCPSSPAPRSLRHGRMRCDGDRALHLLRCAPAGRRRHRTRGGDVRHQERVRGLRLVAYESGAWRAGMGSEQQEAQTDNREPG